MAITAKFEADFSQFNDSVTQAVNLLATLGTSDAAIRLVRQISEVVDASIEWGSSIAKLSAQIGIAAEDVQRLQYIAGQTSVSMSTLTSATQNVTTAVGNHSKGLVQALKALGIEWETFAAADPYQRMVMLAQGIAQIEDPTKRATAAYEAFGGKWREIMPAVLANMEALGQAAPVASAATIQGLDDMSAAMARWGQTTKVWTGNAIVWFENVAKAVIAAKNAQSDPTALLKSAQQHELNLTPEGMAAGIKAPPKPAGLEPLKDYKDAQLSATELKLALIDLNREVDKSITLNKAAAEAQKKHAAAIKEAAQAMEKEQNRAITIMEGKIGEIIKAWEGYDAAVGAASHDTTERQIADVYRHADAQIAAMEKAKTGSIQAYQAIMATADQLAANIVANNIEADATTRAHYQLVADQAKAAYDFALAHATEYTDARIAQLQTEAEAATTALQNWSRNAVTEVEKIKAPAEAATQAIKGMHDQILEMTGVGTKLPGSQEITDSMGKRYLISPTGQRVPMGPHGEMPGNWWEMYTGQGSTPEAFNPLLLQGRRNVGTLAGAAAAANNVTVNVEGNVLGTQNELARMVGDAITNSFRTGGSRLPA